MMVINEVVPTDRPWMPVCLGTVVDDHGRVCEWLDCEWQRVTERPTEKGYVYVSVNGDVKLLSHVVLESFVGPKPVGHFACHFPDKNPGNNKLDNLRWATHQQNMSDEIIHRRIENGIDDSMMAMVYRMYTEIGISITQIAAIYNLPVNAINAILTESNNGVMPAAKADHEVVSAAMVLGRKGGLSGGTARNLALTKEQRPEITRQGGIARWKKKR